MGTICECAWFSVNLDYIKFTDLFVKAGEQTLDDEKLFGNYDFKGEVLMVCHSSQKLKKRN